ncbi:MAG TPA: DHH family phosphoesterase [Cyclobacteriaceae bacterium]|nr:DHH family phosphoesterase [Cyclobacteriaceae bacterium]HND40899.1 DHH family phosphoesterase [Cyclobacteriaceae bacterium]HNK83138.1 DHH family phosphoesterase [Cyclobacteriaceae bacterium]HNL45483.1 DHH family phosphoesterase [Cyclobacteriaceae bacterium]
MGQTRQVVIVTHHKPDADALGSSLGLAGYLRKKGHSVTVITPSDYPEFLHWMPGNAGVLALDKGNEKLIHDKINAAEIIFCLDFSALKRIQDLTDVVRNSGAKKVMIDHHLDPEDFADFVKWEVRSASTAQLIFNLIRELGDEQLIDANIADCLYAGLMTDTGSFRHSNTHYEEFAVAGELVRLGADPSKVSKLIYDTNTLERLRLMGFVLSEKLKVLPEYRTAYMTLSADELKRLGSQTGDTEGLVNYGLSIKGIKLSVMIHERKDSVKLSLRSLGDFSVNEMARRHFEGGGHRNASGGSSSLSLDQTLQKFLSILPEYKEELNRD